MKFSANCCTEPTSRSASSCEAEGVSTRRNSCIVWGIYHRVVEHDSSVVSTWCMGFGHWIPCATSCEIYLKNQSYQSICCIIFQNCRLTRNQIIGTLCANLFSFSVIFHLELAKITSNNNR